MKNLFTFCVGTNIVTIIFYIDTFNFFNIVNITLFIVVIDQRLS